MFDIIQKQKILEESFYDEEIKKYSFIMYDNQQLYIIQNDKDKLMSFSYNYPKYNHDSKEKIIGYLELKQYG